MQLVYSSNHRSVLGAATLAVAVAVAAPVASADDAAEQAAQPSNKTATDLLNTLSGDATGAERLDAATRLAALRPPAVAELDAFLSRQRSSAAPDRRAVLKLIRADVPNKDGKFRAPRRGKDAVNTGDDFDWLSALAELQPDAPGFGDVFADVAAIRALAASQYHGAADVILNFGFSDAGLIYRDECGRYLRKMSPYSLPSLILASDDTKRSRSLRRYAVYQMDRLDRKDPKKALSSARVSHPLVLAVIRAYGVIRKRDAFAPMLDLVSHEAPDIREAARTSVMAYITGKKPRPAPKRKLTLPGGKFTEEEQPLWLDSRELAVVELRRAYERTLGQAPRRSARPGALARAIFEHHDKAIDQARARALGDAKALAAAQDWEGATQAFDRILAVTPDHPERADMARAYYEYGQILGLAEKWPQAAAAYRKAHGLNPDAAFATDALASHHYATGKSLEADGKDGGLAFRRADEIKPDNTEMRAAQQASRPTRRWMLYAGISGGAVALILLILGIAVRRR